VLVSRRDAADELLTLCWPSMRYEPEMTDVLEALGNRQVYVLSNRFSDRIQYLYPVVKQGCGKAPGLDNAICPVLLLHGTGSGGST
jgi:hypothetical protein